MCWILIRLNEILYGQCLRQWDGGGDVIQGNAPLSCHVWWIATQHWHLEHRKRSSTRTVLINSIPYSFKVFQSQPTRPQQTAKDRNTNKEKVDDDINDWLERIKEDINGVESQAQSIRCLNGKNISGLSRLHARRRDSDNKNYKPIPPYRYNNKQQKNKNIFRLMAQSNRWPTLVLPKKRAGLTQAKIKRKQVLRWCGALDTLTGVVAAADAFFFCLVCLSLNISHEHLLIIGYYSKWSHLMMDKTKRPPSYYLKFPFHFISSANVFAYNRRDGWLVKVPQ